VPPGFPKSDLRSDQPEMKPRPNEETLSKWRRDEEQ
jgi:hypothetical protein